MLKNIFPSGRSDRRPARRVGACCPGGQIITNRAGVWDRAGEPAEFRHDQGVAGADRDKGLVEAGAFAGGAGQAVVEVDPVPGDTEFDQSLALGGEALAISGAAGVADQGQDMIGV